MKVGGTPERQPPSSGRPACPGHHHYNSVGRAHGGWSVWLVWGFWLRPMSTATLLWERSVSFLERGVNSSWSWWTFLLPSIRERGKSLVKELALKRWEGKRWITGYGTKVQKVSHRRMKEFLFLSVPLFLGQAVHTQLMSTQAVGKGNLSHREAGRKLNKVSLESLPGWPQVN